MPNIILVALPKQDLNNPPAALALLSSVAKNSGYDVKILDLNQILNKKLDSDTWTEFDTKSALGENIVEISSEIETKVKKIFTDEISSLIDAETKFIALSVFTLESILSTNIMIDILSNFSPEIIVGGTGLQTKIEGSDFYKHIESKVNYVVLGDGEVGFTKILHGTASKIENNTGDINNYPIPDYNYFEKNLYSWNKIYITGSRGCVRNCTFCDVAHYWPQYRYRPANSLIDEIKKQVNDLNVKHFEFTDSLINGSISNFYDFNIKLSQLRKLSDYCDVTYSGQFICRPRNQMPPEHYKAMYHAGCNQLIVGIESFSERVRDDMRKHFSNDDIDYHLEQCAYWGIPNVLLMIVGYPTENDEDHKQNIAALKKYQKYVHTNTIFMISFGYTMHLLHGTPIIQNHPDLDISIPDFSVGNIFNWTNKNSDLKTRIKRRIELHELAYELGYKQPRSHSYLQFMKKLSESNL